MEKSESTSRQNQEFKNIRNKRRNINYLEDTGVKLYEKAREKVKENLEKNWKQEVTERQVNMKLRAIMNVDQRRLRKFSNGHTRSAYDLGEVAHLVIIACDSYIEASYYMWRTGNPIENSSNDTLRLLDDILYLIMETECVAMSPSERIDIANKKFNIENFTSLQDLYNRDDDM